MVMPMSEPIKPAAVPAPSGGASGEPQRFWERYFEVYDTLNEAPPYKKMVARTIELLEPRPGDRVLDAGAGTGNVSRALAAHGARITGIDFCVPALARCRAKVPDAEFLEGDLTKRLPFDDASFDKVACCLVLHFLPPDRQAFAFGELRRVLRPGGRIALTVFAPGLNPLWVYTASLREMWRTDGPASAATTAVTHLVNTARIFYYQWRMRRGEARGKYRYFTDDELRTMLEAQGFDVTHVERAMADQCWTAAAVTRNGQAPAR